MGTQDRIRHYAEPRSVYTLCGERVTPRDVHSSWPDCPSCVREVRRMWGDDGYEEVRVMWSVRLIHREKQTEMLREVLEG